MKMKTLLLGVGLAHQVRCWESSAQTVSARRQRAAADCAKILVEVAAFAAAGAL